VLFSLRWLSDVDAYAAKLLFQIGPGGALTDDHPAEVRRATAAMDGSSLQPTDSDTRLCLDLDLRNFHSLLFILSSAVLREYNCGTFAALWASSHKTREQVNNKMGVL
jgi:hypothetical protein